MYQIQTKLRYKWITLKIKPFDKKEDARRWAQQNYRDNEGLGKENENWRTIKL